MFWFVLLANVAADDVGPPATVLEHELELTLEENRERQSQTWTIRIEDPEACAAGIIAPQGLDGATDKGALVIENVLAFPIDVAEGDVFSLTSTVTTVGGPFSGELLTAPNLPVVEATLKVVSKVETSLWADDKATVDCQEEKSRRFTTFAWHNLAETSQAQAAWTTFASWDEATADTNARVRAKLAQRADLGQQLGASLRGMSPADLLQRVRTDIDLVESQPVSWREARHAREVIRSRSGNATELALVVLSVLKSAKINASAANYRPSGAGGTVPVSIPAPALLTHPLLVVRDEGHTWWIDPAAPPADLEQTPSSMANATVWVPGTPPVELHNASVVHGTVAINTDARVEYDGSFGWTSEIVSEGTATETIRTLLAPLQRNRREEAIRRLIEVGRPNTDRIIFEASGLEDPSRPLRISITGFESEMLHKSDAGVTGPVPPTLGPALAAWLPPNLLIHETISIKVPQSLVILAIITPESGFETDALTFRQSRQEGSRVILTIESQRLNPPASLPREAAATKFLHEQAKIATTLVLMSSSTQRFSDTLSANPDISPIQAATIEASAWWLRGSPQRAKRVLKNSLHLGVGQLAQEMDHLPDDDPRPLALLESLTQLDENRLLIAQSYADHKMTREAWLLAAQLGKKGYKPQVQAEAILLAHRLQPPFPPDDHSDSEGAAMWEDPHQMLERAATAAPDNAEIIARQAAQHLLDGDGEAALEKLAIAREKPCPPRHTALINVIEAEALAQQNRPTSMVMANIERAVHLAPFDVEIMSRAARAMSTIGEPRRALTFALTAAQPGFLEAEQWAEVTHYALAAGDLHTAVFAAQRASDLEPDEQGYATVLTLVGNLAHNKAATQLGLKRTGHPNPPVWPPSLSELIALAPPEALLALLQHHDAEVIESPSLLALRAQLRVDAGLLEQAVLDGLTLANKHKRNDGLALAFSASVGNAYSPATEQNLHDAAEDDLTARAMRLEYQLLTGQNPAADVAALADDPRAKLVGELLGNRHYQASSTIKGFYPNKLLS
ncbi:MAG: hypothetical protein HN348_04875, partial [Proteobacteria bacterium]|nr:hypothetical protein [Pseudomonadota bacterium]